MSKIEDLIKQYCPNGCEWKRLGDVCDITSGSFVKKDKQSTDGRYLVYNGGITHTGYYDEYNAEADKVIISARGAGAGFVNHVMTRFWAGNSCFVLNIIHNTMLRSRFLYYAMTVQMSLIIAKRQEGSIPAVSKNQLMLLQIPVPPLPVQEEIVRILDEFTELEKELEKELEMRKKQYEWYRDELLTFGDDVEYKKLGEVAPFSVERIDVLELDDENYVGVDNLLQDKHGKIISTHVPVNGKCTKYNIGDILIGNIRPYLRKIWFSDRCGGTNGDVLVFHNNLKEKVYDRYLYHILASEMFFLFDINNSKGAKMPRGDKKVILEYPIPVPPLQEQQRIVEILDTFDTLTTDLTKGLPAEIKMRHQQYEYYRDYLFGLLK